MQGRGHNRTSLYMQQYMEFIQDCYNYCLRLVQLLCKIAAIILQDWYNYCARLVQ